MYTYKPEYVDLIVVSKPCEHDMDLIIVYTGEYIEGYECKKCRTFLHKEDCEII